MGKNDPVRMPGNSDIRGYDMYIDFHNENISLNRGVFKILKPGGNIFFLLLLFTISLRPGVFAQTDIGEGRPDWEWLPSGITFRPVVASVYEPRVGFTFFGDKRFVRLDVGNGIDLLGRNFEGGRVAIGGEFFIWTLLESWKNFHFPVIASDYFFGINISYVKQLEGDIFSARLRLTHISAHFVDGHYDREQGGWRDGREPQVYSREFIELLGSYQFGGSILYRIYGGGLYIFSLTPDWPGRVTLQTGGDIFIPTRLRYVTPYIAYDLRLTELERWRATHSLQIGIKLGRIFGRGIDVFGAYFSGLYVQGELFDQSISYWGGGFNLHF
jgi:hypothetical protein